MSKVNVRPIASVLADPVLATVFQQWQSAIESSGFYLAADIDSHGACDALLLFNQAEMPVGDPAGLAVQMVWDYLPPVVHGPLRGILFQSLPGVAQRTLRIALHDVQERWLECITHHFTNGAGESRILLLVRETTAAYQPVPALQQDKVRATAYEQFNFSMLELVLQEPDATRVLEKIARDIEAMHTDLYCAIVITQQLGKLVQTVIAPTLPQPLLETLCQLQLEAGNGSLATSITRKQRVIVDNVMTHPYWVNHRDAAQAAGIQAGWVEPMLTAAGDILGALAIYYRQPQTPDTYEQSMIAQAAKLVSIVVDRHLSRDTIQTLAYLEPVTGLPNRRRTYELLQQLHTQAVSGESLGMIYIDLDHFKWINEAHGHTLGNHLLQQVAERLQKVTTPHFLACMGGDEFLILLSELDGQGDAALQQVWSMQRKIQKIFERPFKVGSQKLSITASMGLCCFNELEIRDTDCVKAVDIAMHRAKQAGRNTACLYEPGMQTEIATQVMLEAELREAIEQAQLRLHYQVQVDHTGRPFGAEALLRWEHPERGFIPPAQFIPVAECSSLIVEMGQWVLDQACAQIAQWQRVRKTSDLSLSVNISARQFRQANFTAMVKACVQHHQINPNALRLELTESLLLENVDDAVSIMNELSQLGIQFSLDDFGTGYSSLQYLKKLPLYQLKIDRSFVNDIVTDSHDRTIVRTIIAMAQSMYLSVIAEGVETQEQMELLLNNGCRRYQGYLFGKPMAIKEFDAWLEQALA
ncbi:diguanylate cyclase (GGDEF) domain-containing protein [Methylophilus rhizosphaerae]|uniref:Diguanylate cyclase (GGDEF) domain-containing protein n=1 Tax=Methylophilus rhizosphaerae TaxID=492660 RepID=A0A1G9AUZ0_9PROT|nr:EAL domain-containing protein [Methylophilus rhizosphaerae]SDK30405.1 diguanylate cyclase (GGDEF) domain-containing protein [Methylophilus rhizosphaerae]